MAPIGKRSRLAFIIAAFVFFTPLPLTTAQAAASEDATLFVNLTSDDPWRAEMALHYAKQVQGMGKPVVIFLNVTAVRLADKGIADAGEKAGASKAQQALMAMMENGATVYVCGMCTQRAGMSENDWIDGVKPGSRETIDIQMDHATKVLSF